MNILIVSFNNFPDGNAGAVREYTFGKLFKSLGHNVVFLGMGKSTYGIKQEYKSFEYTSLRLSGKGLKRKLENYFNYSSRLNGFLHEYHEKYKIDIILVVDIPINALNMVKNFSSKRGIYLLHDSVEWYSPNQFKLGYLSPAYILKDMYNRFLINEQFRVIAISSFLEKHFKSRKIKVVKIPIIFDPNETSYNKHKNTNKLTLLYAGSPGKKDYLKEMLEGLALLSDDHLSKLEFRILGVNLNQVTNLVSHKVYSKIKNSIKIYGYVSREDVLKNLEDTDFTVMLRSEEQRYAKAGFPTKVVESLATGTPVILNITSDLDKYIIDGYNGLIVSKCSSIEFSNTLDCALKMSTEQIEIMKMNARKSAEKNFDFNKYKTHIEEILDY